MGPRQGTILYQTRLSCDPKTHQHSLALDQDRAPVAATEMLNQGKLDATFAILLTPL